MSLGIERMTFWAWIPHLPNGGHRPFPPHPAALPLPTHHLQLPSWTPRTYFRIPTSWDHHPQRATPIPGTWVGSVYGRENPL